MITRKTYTYAYVLAIADLTTREIEFHSRTVVAGTEEEAYREGGKLLTQAGVFPVQAGKFANDYVHRTIKV